MYIFFFLEEWPSCNVWQYLHIACFCSVIKKFESLKALYKFSVIVIIFMSLFLKIFIINLSLGVYFAF